MEIDDNSVSVFAVTWILGVPEGGTDLEWNEHLGKKEADDGHGIS